MAAGVVSADGRREVCRLVTGTSVAAHSSAARPAGRRHVSTLTAILGLEPTVFAFLVALVGGAVLCGIARLVPAGLVCSARAGWNIREGLS